MRVTSTSVADTLEAHRGGGLLLAANTIHGWRPISVEIQPADMASSGPSTINEEVTCNNRPPRHRALGGIATAP
jgi:hypothetical protein